MKTKINVNKKTRKNIKNKKNDTTDKKNVTTNNNETTDKNKTCKQPYKPFEKNVEELFKEHKIDYLSTNYNLSKELIKDLRKAVNVKGVSPNDDYYSYINDRWIDNKFDNANYNYIVQYDNVRIVQDKVFKELIDITDEFVNKKINDTSSYEYKLQKCMKTYITGLSNYTNNEPFVKIKNEYVNHITNLCKDKQNIWKMLAFLNNSEVTSWSAPLVWKVYPDDKNPKFYKTYIGVPKMTLTLFKLYVSEPATAYEKKYLKNYKTYLHDLFEVAFGKNHNYNPNDVFECEKKIISSFICDSNGITDDPNYNLVTKNECLKKYNFDWEKFVLELGYKSVPPDFICGSKVYLHCIIKLLLNEWNSKQWQTYYIFMYIRVLERLTKNGQHVTYMFEGNHLVGQQNPTPENLLNLVRLGFAFPYFYNNEYIKHYKNDEVIEYAKALSEDLKQVFTRIIRRNNWLQPQTKKKALAKLDKFKINIGSSIININDPLLDYTTECPWINIQKVAFWRKSMFINLDGKEVTNSIPMIDWSLYPPKFIGNHSFIVNAMYTPTLNGIDIPLGYLQKPFIDLEERGIEYNLAHIGYTIGHEMSHALDNNGSKYDETGALNNWWTKKDAQKYAHIQEDIIKQYEAFALMDGIEFDASISIGEDLADISGVVICLEYLRDFQLKNQDILPIKRLSFQAFFIYFAVQQKQKLNKKSIEAQLVTNPHPLDKYRTNVPLSRIEVFRELYNIKKGDKMWWPSTNKVWMD